MRGLGLGEKQTENREKMEEKKKFACGFLFLFADVVVYYEHCIVSCHSFSRDVYAVSHDK